MRLRNTVILAIIFAALGGYVYFVELDKAAEEAKKKTLVELDADAVTGVTLAYPDREIVLTKTDSGWRLTKPVDAAADETTVKNLIEAVATCEVKKTLDEVPDNLATFGLDQPHATITIKLKDKELPAIRIGKTSPVGNSTFVQRADEKKIYLTGSAFHSGMDKQAKDLRDKQVLQLDEDDVRQIRISGDGRDVLLTKTNDSWTLERPGPYAADPNAMRSLVSSLSAMRTTDFPPDDQAEWEKYGLQTPRLIVTVGSGKDGGEQALLFGGETEKKEVYLKVGDRPTVYTVGSYVFTELSKDPNEFRDKTVLAFDKDAVTQVDVTPTGGQPFVIRRNNQQWTLDGSTEPLDQTKLTQYVNDLSGLKGYMVASDRPDTDAQFGLLPPKLTITVFGKDDQALGTIRLGSYSPEANRTDYSAAREGSPTVLLVREHQYKRLDKRAGDFVALPATTPAAAAAAAPAH